MYNVENMMNCSGRASELGGIISLIHDLLFFPISTIESGVS